MLEGFAAATVLGVVGDIPAVEEEVIVAALERGEGAGFGSFVSVKAFILSFRLVAPGTMDGLGVVEAEAEELGKLEEAGAFVEGDADTATGFCAGEIAGVDAEEGGTDVLAVEVRDDGAEDAEEVAETDFAAGDGAGFGAGEENSDDF